MEQLGRQAVLALMVSLEIPETQASKGILEPLAIPDLLVPDRPDLQARSDRPDCRGQLDLRAPAQQDPLDPLARLVPLDPRVTPARRVIPAQQDPPDPLVRL